MFTVSVRARPKSDTGLRKQLGPTKLFYEKTEVKFHLTGWLRALFSKPQLWLPAASQLSNTLPLFFSQATNLGKLNLGRLGKSACSRFQLGPLQKVTLASGSIWSHKIILRKDRGKISLNWLAASYIFKSTIVASRSKPVK